MEFRRVRFRSAGAICLVQGLSHATVRRGNRILETGVDLFPQIWERLITSAITSRDIESVARKGDISVSNNVGKADANA